MQLLDLALELVLELVLLSGIVGLFYFLINPLEFSDAFCYLLEALFHLLLELSCCHLVARRPARGWTVGGRGGSREWVAQAVSCTTRGATPLVMAGAEG